MSLTLPTHNEYNWDVTLNAILATLDSRTEVPAILLLNATQTVAQYEAVNNVTVPVGTIIARKQV